MFNKTQLLPKKIISSLVMVLFAFSTVVTPVAFAQALPSFLNMPASGTMLTSTAAFQPAVIMGINIRPEDSLKFDFIIDKGESGLEGEAFNAEANKLIKYFLAALTTPQEQMWVNLSPYESGRIIPEVFGRTEMGRDMLAQDYILKQLSASLLSPEEALGEEFWRRFQTKAKEQFGSNEIPLSVFNKIWIVPETASIYEHSKGAYIVASHLNVMLEQDYLALEVNRNSTEHGLGSMNDTDLNQITDVAADIIRQVLLPEIEKEVNQGRLFAPLRQIFHSMLLAKWYKDNLKESLLGQVYADQGKTDGVNVDPATNQQIYDAYLKAFETGAYNYVKEEYDPTSQTVIPKKYFSGGVDAVQLTLQNADALMIDSSSRNLVTVDAAMSGQNSLSPQAIFFLFKYFNESRDKRVKPLYINFLQKYDNFKLGITIPQFQQVYDFWRDFKAQGMNTEENFISAYRLWQEEQFLDFPRSTTRRFLSDLIYPSMNIAMATIESARKVGGPIDYRRVHADINDELVVFDMPLFNPEDTVILVSLISDFEETMLALEQLVSRDDPNFFPTQVDIIRDFQQRTLAYFELAYFKREGDPFSGSVDSLVNQIIEPVNGISDRPYAEQSVWANYYLGILKGLLELAPLDELQVKNTSVMKSLIARAKQGDAEEETNSLYQTLSERRNATRVRTLTDLEYQIIGEAMIRGQEIIDSRSLWKRYLNKRQPLGLGFQGLLLTPQLTQTQFFLAYDLEINKRELAKKRRELMTSLVNASLSMPRPLTLAEFDLFWWYAQRNVPQQNAWFSYQVEILEDDSQFEGNIDRDYFNKLYERLQNVFLKNAADSKVSKDSEPVASFRVQSQVPNISRMRIISWGDQQGDIKITATPDQQDQTRIIIHNLKYNRSTIKDGTKLDMLDVSFILADNDTLEFGFATNTQSHNAETQTPLIRHNGKIYKISEGSSSSTYKFVLVNVGARENLSFILTRRLKNENGSLNISQGRGDQNTPDSYIIVNDGSEQTIDLTNGPYSVSFDSTGSKDSALLSDVGGIDFNPDAVEMKVFNDGEGFTVIPPTFVEIQKFMNNSGFVPVIINVTPVTSLPLLLGLVEENYEFDVLSRGF